MNPLDNLVYSQVTETTSLVMTQHPQWPDDEHTLGRLIPELETIGFRPRITHE